jgi:hypothetical protein
MDNYKDKYLKYKEKYLLLKALEQKGGMGYFYNPTSLLGDGLESFRKGLNTIIDVAGEIGKGAIDKSKELLKIINIEFSKLDLLIQKLFPKYYYLLNGEDLIRFSSLIKTIETYKNLGKKCNYVCSQVYESYTPRDKSPNPCPEENRIYSEENYDIYTKSISLGSTDFKEAPLQKNNGQYISRMNKLIKDIREFTKSFRDTLTNTYNKDDATIELIIKELDDKLSISDINKVENDCKY